MLTKLKSRRGETLIEVLVAIIIIIVGALSAVRLLGIASIHNQLTKERVIATNLSREGLEAVRNIRDTNWLRFAGERRRCWNNADFANPIECKDNNSDGIPNDVIIHEQQYIVKFDGTNYRWELDEVGLTSRLDLEDGEIGEDDEKYRLRINSVTGLFNHEDEDLDDSDGEINENSVYFREIYTEYLESDQTLAASESANILRITSKVEWYDRGKISDVTLTTIITDYLGRKNHD